MDAILTRHGVIVPAYVEAATKVPSAFRIADISSTDGSYLIFRNCRAASQQSGIGRRENQFPPRMSHMWRSSSTVWPTSS
jgi:hypothetical protein